MTSKLIESECCNASSCTLLMSDLPSQPSSDEQLLSAALDVVLSGDAVADVGIVSRGDAVADVGAASGDDAELVDVVLVAAIFGKN